MRSVLFPMDADGSAPESRRLVREITGRSVTASAGPSGSYRLAVELAEVVDVHAGDGVIRFGVVHLAGDGPLCDEDASPQAQLDALIGLCSSLGRPGAARESPTVEFVGESHRSWDGRAFHVALAAIRGDPEEVAELQASSKVAKLTRLPVEAGGEERIGPFRTAVAGGGAARRC